MRSPAAPQAPDLSHSLEPGRVTDLEPRADLDGLTFTDLFSDAVDLRDASLRESQLVGSDLTVVRAWGGRWKNVLVHGGRLGSLEAYDATWSAVEVSGCKISYLNLRGSDVTDLMVSDCLIDDLDVDDASLTRVSFEGCRIRRLSVRNARMDAVDLRTTTWDDIDTPENLAGATVTPLQLMELAPLLAASLRIEVAEP